MSAVKHTHPQAPSVVALGLDVDPNTTEPDGLRTLHTPLGLDAVQTDAFVIAIGGACTVRLWMYDRTLRRWASLGAAVACAQDAVTKFVDVPTDVVLFPQVTANVGNATRIGVGFYGSGRG